MTSKTTIRPAVEGDYDAIEALLKADRIVYTRELPREFKRTPTVVMRRGSYINSLDGEEPDWQFFVAEQDGKVVGYIELNIEKDEGNRVRRPRKVLEIEDVIVDKRYREQGIGHLLMQQAEAWGASRKAQEIRLFVYRARPEAKQLYDSLGFNDISTNMVKYLE